MCKAVDVQYTLPQKSDSSAADVDDLLPSTLKRLSPEMLNIIQMHNSGVEIGTVIPSSCTVVEGMASFVDSELTSVEDGQEALDRDDGDENVIVVLYEEPMQSMLGET